MEPVTQAVPDIFGLGTSPNELTVLQMAIRAGLIYALMLVLVRLGNKRFLSKATAFDVIVAIILGSVMSRSINGSAPLLPTIVASAVIMGMHWLFSYLAFSTEWFGSIVKGNRVLLVEDGKVQEAGMREGSITRADLEQAMHLQLNHGDIGKVRRAYLERDGQISLVETEGEPQILSVDIEDGVKTVRIELE